MKRRIYVLHRSFQVILNRNALSHVCVTNDRENMMLDTSEPQRVELSFLNRVPVLQLRDTDFKYVLFGHPFLKHGRQCERCEVLKGIVNERSQSRDM